MNAPRFHEVVTIGIATYNGGRHVAAAVRSAVATGARVIVSDDASSDGTPQLLRALGPAVDLTVHVTNRGIGGNYSFILSRCQTPLLLLLNQDDLVDPVRVPRLLPGDDEVLVMNGWVVDEAGDRRRLIYRRPPARATLLGVYRGLLRENFIRSPSQVLIPVDAARRSGGFTVPDARGQGAEDWLCWLRLASLGLRFRLSCTPRMAYRVHAGNFSHNRDAMAASRAAVRRMLPPPPPRDRRLTLVR